jgi:NAD(P)-dependent dehydrogenase (short-subunit alcohol dehydrogenase family)
MGFPTFVYNQLLVHPQLPPYTFADQVVIVTGANTGIGLETARHISRLGAAKVILAVRNLASGEAARASIESSTGRVPGTCVEVWHLDLVDTASVLAFADKALALPRLDAFIANAALATKVFRLAEGGYETSVTVNNISTFLLALILLPKLQKTGAEYPNRFRAPHLTILTSQVHAWPQFPQWKDPRGVFVALSDEKTAKMDERYPVTRLLGVLLTRELVSRLGDDPGVVVNLVETGFCDTELSRENNGIEEVAFNLWKRLFARTAEQGSRTVVAGASAGKESHGAFMVNGVPAPEALGKWCQSKEGGLAGKRVWDEFSEIVEGIRPGVLKGLV